MDRLYSRFVKAGDLVFDIGAHVGDRAAVFRRFGARVVAVEPQPALIRTLKLLYGRDPALAIEPVAVGRSAGILELKLNVDNPTVSTASEAFRKAANGAAATTTPAPSCAASRRPAKNRFGSGRTQDPNSSGRSRIAVSIRLASVDFPDPRLR